MASGKRASMREGPLAALFRKTETEGLEDRGGAEAPPEPPRAEERPAAPAPASQASQPAPEPRVPTPQERLRHAFSSDLPENMMSPPPAALTSPAQPPAAPAAYYPPPPEAVGSPQLRVVGVGGAGVNAVNRMIEAEVAGVEFVA